MILYIDLDNTIFDYDKQLATYQLMYPDVKYVQGLPMFFETLIPLPNAIETVKLLMETYNVWFLTAPSYMNPLSYTGKRISIETHFGIEFCKRLIMCYDKSLLKGDILIDDNAFGKGQEWFDGELIHFGTEEFPNWNIVYDYLVDLM